MNTETTFLISEDEFVSEDVMSLNHSLVTYQIGTALLPYRANFTILPELEMELPAGRVKPDMAVYPLLTFSRFRDIIRMTTPPLIAVEVLSPKQAMSDLTSKINDVYLPAGTQSCWLVLPELRTVHVFLASGQEQVLSTGLLTDTVTGICVDIADIFAGL